MPTAVAPLPTEAALDKMTSNITPLNPHTMPSNVPPAAATSCAIADIEDEEACAPCVKTTECGNTCGRCELCPGKSIADLPADCSPPSGSGGATGAGGSGDPGGPGYTCDDGEQVCGPGLPGCSLGSYCSLGCCIVQEPK